MTRRLLCLPAALLLALLLSSSALAAKPERRIVNGTEAAQGEYPAQGFLGINTDADPAYRELLRRHARRHRGSSSPPPTARPNDLGLATAGRRLPRPAGQRRPHRRAAG